MKLALHWQIIIAIIIGTIFGICFYPSVQYVEWMGVLFLRALNMLVLPLIICSIISAIGNFPNKEALKRIGTRTIFFYLGTSVLAILTGMAFIKMFCSSENNGLTALISSDSGIDLDDDELLLAVVDSCINNPSINVCYGDTLKETIIIDGETYALIESLDDDLGVKPDNSKEKMNDSKEKMNNILRALIISGKIRFGDKKSLMHLCYKKITDGEVDKDWAEKKEWLIDNYKKIRYNQEKLEKIKMNQPKSFNEFLMNMIPNNVFEDMANGNRLPIIIFAILTGTLIHFIPPSNAQMIKFFFQSCFELIMQMMQFVVRLAPLGVFGLIAVQCAQFEGDINELVQVAGVLGWFMFVSVLALGFHFFVTMSVFLMVFAKVNPIRHIMNMFPTLLTAFSTASTSATIPLSMDCLEKGSGVSRQTSGFAIPLGATFNLNGTALYLCAVVVFFSQANGITLTLPKLIELTIVIILSSLGTGYPMASYVMFDFVFGIFGLSKNGLPLVLAFDRIIDMARTTVNVYGNTCSAVYIARTEGEELKG